MKKIFQYGVIVISMVYCCAGSVDTTYATAKEAPKPAKGSTEELYQDICLTLLDPYIQKAVDNYYKQYFKHPPGEVPFMEDILSIDRPNGYRTFEFSIKVQVMPFFGPHIQVGIDNITFKVGVGNVVQLEKYEHINSFKLPWNYQDEIKKMAPNLR